MSYMFSFFKKQPTAAVFVDFEHWCYSLFDQYGMRPEIQEFYGQIAKDYDIKRIMFFGDFTKPGLRNHVEEIRKVTNSIIDTQNGTSRIKKDFTDFIMLDYIYQDVDLYPKTNTYIIFSGDGHFSSVATYLTVRKKKKLIVYGVKDATSSKLKDLAHEYVLLPTGEQENNICYKLIISNLDYLAKQPQIKHPTFTATVKAVSNYNQVEEEKVKNALIDLINQGVINQKKIKVNFQDKKVLQVDWDIAKERGLWEPR